jgi:hypothetical protein
MSFRQQQQQQQQEQQQQQQNHQQSQHAAMVSAEQDFTLDIEKLLAGTEVRTTLMV